MMNIVTIEIFLRTLLQLFVEKYGALRLLRMTGYEWQC